MLSIVIAQTSYIVNATGTSFLTAFDIIIKNNVFLCKMSACQFLLLYVWQLVSVLWWWLSVWAKQDACEQGPHLFAHWGLANISSCGGLSCLCPPDVACRGGEAVSNRLAVVVLCRQGQSSAGGGGDGAQRAASHLPPLSRRLAPLRPLLQSQQR